VKGKWRYLGLPVHAIYGWLQISEVIDNPGGGIIPGRGWLDRHPHTQPGRGGINVIYVAREELEIGSSLVVPGFGVFKKPFHLTAPQAPTKSVWQVPDWLHLKSGGVGMSYHPPEAWLANRLLQSAARGQEFVADVGARPDALDWAATVISQHR
jgi:hypothetical protein